MSRCVKASVAHIQSLAEALACRDEFVLARAGTSMPKLPPGGMGFIVDKSGKRDSLGFTGGITPIKKSGAFTAPVFFTKTSAVRKGYAVEHFAEVLPTTSEDVEHESYYPEPGDHERPGMTSKIDGKIVTQYWRVSPEISALIRLGEEEHLADAVKAYELTYKLVADTINSMVGTKFGPAGTPGSAENAAAAELAKRLPPELGSDPKNWAAMLNKLIDKSKERDDQGWHTLGLSVPIREGNKIIHVVEITGTTKIGQVSASQLIKY
jgi:hypothetical protein